MMFVQLHEAILSMSKSHVSANAFLPTYATR